MAADLAPIEPTLLDPAGAQSQLLEARRRQALAQSLIEQSQQMPDSSRMAGRYVVQNSPLEYIAKALQGVKGQRMAKQANEQERTALADALRGQQAQRAAEEAAKEADAERVLTGEQYQSLMGRPLDAGAVATGVPGKRVTKYDRAPQASVQQRPRLKPGERFKSDGSDEVEAILGSDLYKKQADAHAKDQGSVVTVSTQTDNAVRKIDAILAPENNDAFNNMFGGYNAKVATQFTPGATQDIKKELESLQSDLKKAGLDMMRQGGSIGVMTVQEWPIVAGAIETIDPMLSEKAAREKLEYVRGYLQRIRDNAAAIYQREWGESQFNKDWLPPPPAAAPHAGVTVKTPDGQEFTFPNQQAADAWKAKNGL